MNTLRSVEVSEATRIKRAHLASFVTGTKIAARLFKVRQHWVKSARECGYTFGVFQIAVRS